MKVLRNKTRIVNVSINGKRMNERWRKYSEFLKDYNCCIVTRFRGLQLKHWNRIQNSYSSCSLKTSLNGCCRCCWWLDDNNRQCLNLLKRIININKCPCARFILISQPVHHQDHEMYELTGVLWSSCFKYDLNTRYLKHIFLSPTPCSAGRLICEEGDDVSRWMARHCWICIKNK